MSTSLDEVVFIISGLAMSNAFLCCFRDWLKRNIKEIRWWICFFILRGLLFDGNPRTDKQRHD